MNARISVLILEQENEVAANLEPWLREKGYYLVKIDRAEIIVPLIDSRDRIYTIVLVDDFSVEGSFVENLKILKQLAPKVPVVTTTQFNNPEKEKIIRKHDVFYYHIKNEGVDELKTSILCALEESVTEGIFMPLRPDMKL